VTVIPGAGQGGSNRVTLTFPDFSIRNTWLQVTVAASPTTGLATPDVFYFGNTVGETGNVPDEFSVSVTDELLARNNAYSGQSVPTPVTSRFDFNRDGSVSVIDQLLARNNMTTTATKLKVITVPSSLVAGGLHAQAMAESAVEALFSQASGIAASATAKSAGAAVATLSVSTRKAASDALFAAMDESESSSIRNGRGAKAAANDDLWNLL
jgi:hypothetical protein